MVHFMETNLEEGEGSLTQFWSQCHEDMMMNHHRHNREIGESRLKFKVSLLAEGNFFSNNENLF